eukprot:5015561-Pleurochrysis_carterae.AAC.2
MTRVDHVIHSVCSNANTRHCMLCRNGSQSRSSVLGSSQLRFIISFHERGAPVCSRFQDPWRGDISPPVSASSVAGAHTDQMGSGTPTLRDLVRRRIITDVLASFSADARGAVLLVDSFTVGDAHAPPRVQGGLDGCARMRARLRVPRVATEEQLLARACANGEDGCRLSQIPEPMSTNRMPTRPSLPKDARTPRTLTTPRT